MSLVPLETYISRRSAPAERTRQFAFYGVALTLGGALGVWSGLHLHRMSETLGFVLGGGVPVVGAFMLVRGFGWSDTTSDDGRAAPPLLHVRHFLSFATAWCQGFLEGGMLAFLSLYLLSRGYAAHAAGGLMVLTMAGVILFQVPVSWLADRFGRVPVLCLCYVVVGVALWVAPSCQSFVGLGLALFLFGGCTGAMYPLGLALLGERTPEASLARAYAWYLAIECLGSQLGAAAMGQARDRWGEASMFGVGLIAVLLVPAGWVVVRLKRQAAPIRDAQGGVSAAGSRQAA
jgi:predicted MFS family arabinose efflux permease